MSLIGARQIVDLSSALREHLGIEYSRDRSDVRGCAEADDGGGARGASASVWRSGDSDSAANSRGFESGEGRGQHQTIFEYARNSRAAHGFLKVAEEIRRLAR